MKNENKVECKICNKKYKSISRTHLLTHNMTMEQYKKQFPHSPMHSNSTKKKLSTNRLEYWVDKHGKDKGKEEYEKYKKFLGEKNTFEYKHKVHGWSKDDFDTFNKKRAVTLENLIIKHGDLIGRKKYNDYVEKQRYVGISEDYFIEKLGEVDGKKRFKEVCDKKAHNLKNYERIYGSKTAAKEKLKDFFTKIENNEFSSSVEQEFIVDLLITMEKDYSLKFSKVYSIIHGNQYGVWSKRLEKLIKMDLVILDLDVCIEFNGNYWHCNPEMYTENFVHPNLKMNAADIWERDDKRYQDIAEHGMHVKVIWEKDYKNNRDKIIKDTIEWIHNLKDQK